MIVGTCLTQCSTEKAQPPWALCKQGLQGGKTKCKSASRVGGLPAEREWGDAEVSLVASERREKKRMMMISIYGTKIFPRYLTLTKKIELPKILEDYEDYLCVCVCTCL